MYTQLCCVYTNVTCKPKRRHSKNERQNETENKDRKSEPSDSRLQSQRFCIFIFAQRTFFKYNFSQPHKWHICKTAQANPEPKFCKRAIFCQRSTKPIEHYK